MVLYVLLLTTFLGSFFLSLFVFHFGPKLGFQDVPNERSSHREPVARGGGFGIFLNFTFGLVVLKLMGVVSFNYLLGLLVGGTLTFLVGLGDDRWSLPARARLVVHFVAALWTMIFITQGLGGNYKIDIGIAELSGVFLCGAFSILFISWMINLYNFIDGIDGQAGAIGFVVAALLGGLAYWQGYSNYELYFIYASAIFGFLIVNWYPAKVFMGDCGSGFLGFIFAVMALLGEFRGGLPLLATVMLLSPIIVDATYTLIVRVLLGHRPYEPHREFLFQRFIQKGWPPPRLVLSGVLAILVWNLPLTVASLLWPQHSALFLVATYAPYTLLAWQKKAGYPIHSQIVKAANERLLKKSLHLHSLDFSEEANKNNTRPLEL